MPTYEYACPACGIVEVFQSITEKALTRCPQCKKRKVTRMLSGGAGVIFKGSGFWETDYNRSDEYKAKSKSESEGGSPSKDTSSETKTKTETKTKLAEPAAPDTGKSAGDGKRGGGGDGDGKRGGGSDGKRGSDGRSGGDNRSGGDGTAKPSGQQPPPSKDR